MKRIIKVLFVIISLSFCNIVFADNSIDYKLTITNDNIFEEEINYFIDDYEKPENGLNESLLVINNDTPVFIDGDTMYQRETNFDNNIYNVNLKYTYDKNTINNARFINICFSNHNFINNSNTISYFGDGDFLCKYDNLTIRIISDKKPTSSNADEVNGNEYIWKPKSNNFSIDIRFEEEETDNNNNNQKESNKEQDESSIINTNKSDLTIAYIIIAVLVVVIGLFVLTINNKKNSY